MTRRLRYDAVVIGAGVAGLTAAARLAQRGATVVVLARGFGSTHLAPGTIDVLGRDPELVRDPASALPAFVAAHPGHPYALTGIDAIEPALRWLRASLDDGPAAGYRYVGGLEHNQLLPTAVGAVRPSALVPETMAGGDTRDPAPICIVGIRVLRDFHATLCAANLTAAGVEARAVIVDVAADRADASTLGLAHRFDEPDVRAAFAAQLAPLLRPGERVGLPALLGRRDPHGAWADLEQRLGRPVFEIPGLPPSVPGMRLFDALRHSLRAAGGTIALGAQVTGMQRAADRVTAIEAHQSGGEREYETDLVVVATGGFASGALELRSDWTAHDAALGLALDGVPAPGEARFVSDHLAEQPISRAGIAVDGSLRAGGLENLYVVGASLPGAVPWREGSGDGIALTTGHHVAQTAAVGVPAGASA